jgi:hypothetical protein
MNKHIVPGGKAWEWFMIGSQFTESNEFKISDSTFLFISQVL